MTEEMKITNLRELYNRINGDVTVIEESVKKLKRALADLENLKEKPLEDFKTEVD